MGSNMIDIIKDQVNIIKKNGISYYEKQYALGEGFIKFRINIKTGYIEEICFNIEKKHLKLNQ